MRSPRAYFSCLPGALIKNVQTNKKYDTILRASASPMLLAPPWPSVRASPCCPTAGCSTRVRCGPALARLHAPAPASARPPPRRRALRLCCAGTPLQPPTQPPPPFDARRVFRATTKALSNLPLALAEMAVLAGLSAVGTVIEQNKARERSCVRQHARQLTLSLPAHRATATISRTTRWSLLF